MWTELAPEDSEGHRVYGALLLRSGQLASAVAQFEKLIALGGEDNDFGFESGGELLARERDRSTPRAAMGKLLTGRESNVHALYAYAMLAARAGEVDQSIGLLRQLLVVDPHHDRGAVLYARLLQQKGNVSDALNSLATALEQNPKAEGVRLTYARLLVDAKRYEDARTQFEWLLKDAPDNVDVRYMLGLLLLQTNHLEEARGHFERLTSVGDRRLAAHYYLGQIAESNEEVERALLEYREVDEGEHYLGAQIRVAVLLAEQGKLEEARDHLQGLPRDNALQDIQIYRAEAEILTRSNELDLAMQVYDQALSEYAKNPDLLYARAMLAEKLDRLDVLESDLRTILEDEPDNADALNALGFTLADRTERYEEALQLISRALELKPDDYYILDSMGWVLYRVGRYAEALEYLRRALTLSDDPEVAAHLGEVLWVSGDKEGAREVWNTALKITPDDERLLEVINRFTD
jgi:tetratricopeptide (TPR) repeat protein